MISHMVSTQKIIRSDGKPSENIFNIKIDFNSQLSCWERNENPITDQNSWIYQENHEGLLVALDQLWVE